LLVSPPESVVTRLRPARLLAYMNLSARSTSVSGGSAGIAMVAPTDTVTRTCWSPFWIQEFSESMRTRSAAA